jgi:hypothetical protein
MSDYTVAITGATGKTGRNVVSSALGRGWQVRALSRRPAALGQWIPFDWDNQRSWPLAFAGSDAAYILIPFNHPGAPERTPDLIVEPRPGRGRDRLASLRHRAREDPPSWTQKAHTGRASACVCRIGRADRLRLTPPDELRSWVLMRRAGHVDCATSSVRNLCPARRSARMSAQS